MLPIEVNLQYNPDDGGGDVFASVRLALSPLACWSTPHLLVRVLLAESECCGSPLLLILFIYDISFLPRIALFGASSQKYIEIT